MNIFHFTSIIFIDLLLVVSLQARGDFPYDRDADERTVVTFNSARTKPRNWLTRSVRNWMAYIPDGTFLRDISIPGTHESLSLHCDDDAQDDEKWTCTGISGVRYYVKCNIWGLNKQLRAGIRYFDLRVKSVNGELRVYHGEYNQKQKVITAIRQIANFLDKKPSETILLRIKFIGKNNDGARWQTIIDEMGDYFVTIDRTLNKVQDDGDIIPFPSPKLGDVRGKIVLLRDFDYDNDGFGMVYCTDNDEKNRDDGCAFQIQDEFRVTDIRCGTVGVEARICDGSYGTYTHIEDKVSMATDYINLVSSGDSTGTRKIVLNHLSGTGVSETFGSLVDTLLWDETLTTRQVARDLNGNIYEFIAGKERVPLGVVIMDWPGESLIYRVIESNFDPTIQNCDGKKACRGVYGRVGEGGCIGNRACFQLENGDVGNNACVGQRSCYRAESFNIGENACVGWNACSKKKGRVGESSCLGAQACMDSVVNIGDGFCTMPYSCYKLRNQFVFSDGDITAYKNNEITNFCNETICQCANCDEVATDHPCATDPVSPCFYNPTNKSLPTIVNVFNLN